MLPRVMRVVQAKPESYLPPAVPAQQTWLPDLADAMIDSTPLVCITGQVYAHLLGTDAFQETDVINITTPVTKWNYQITDATEIPSVLAKAFYMAAAADPARY